MSIDMVGWVFHQDIDSPSKKLVLLALADFADQNGHVWATIDVLVRKTSLNRKTVISSLSALEAEGYLLDTGERKGDTGRVKIFLLNTDGHEETTLTKQYQKRNDSKNGMIPKTDGNSPKNGQVIVPKTASNSPKNGTQAVYKPSNEPARNHAPEPADPFAPRNEKQAKDDALIVERLKLNPEWEIEARRRSEGKQNPEGYARTLLLRWESEEWTPPTPKKEPSPPMPPTPPLPDEFAAAKPEGVAEHLWRQHLGTSKQQLLKQKAFGEGGYDRTIHAHLVISQALHKLGMSTPTPVGATT